jgi:O-antigen/teichoic acid export membrane protein
LSNSIQRIRQQSILSSIVVYIGFALGFLNTYLFTIEGGFTQEQYGLTGIFIAIANIMLSFSNLGMLVYVYKFHPYYKTHLAPSKNDMFFISLVVSGVGFLIILISAFIFKDLVVQKYSTHSPDFVKYYRFLFPFGYGLTLYSLLESFAWQFERSVLTHFFREVIFRLLTTLLIVLTYRHIIESFDLFIKIYSFTYLGIAILLGGYLLYTKKIYIYPKISKLTHRLKKQIITLCAFLWSGSLIFNLSQFFDTIVIASVVKDGLKATAVYTLAQNISSLVQAPQRALQAAVIPHFSTAWKDKNPSQIQLIYQRGSINQLLFSVGMFALIWMNFTEAINTFHLKTAYIDAKNIFLFIGLMRIIEMTFGLSSQIISTSVYWRFDFFTGIILLSLALPLNYFLAKEWGAIGPAISNLIAFSIYFAIRFTFLYKKFGIQPLTIQSLYILIVGICCYCMALYPTQTISGFYGIILRSLIFVSTYIVLAYRIKISEDLNYYINKCLRVFQ